MKYEGGRKKAPAAVLLRAARLRRDEVAENWWRGGRKQSWLFAGIGQLLNEAIEVGLEEVVLDDAVFLEF